MKNSFLTSFIVFLFSMNTQAQYSTDWIRPADNIAKTGSMIARDSSDNLFVTGFIQSQNIYTRKYDKFGTLIWEKSTSSGIASNYEKPVWMNIDHNNNALIVGYRYTLTSGRDFPNAIIVLKYNSVGSLLWKKVIPVSVVLTKFGSGLFLRSQVDQSGNLYIGTSTASTSGLGLYKLNSSGITVFTKTAPANLPMGFSGMRLMGNRLITSGMASNTGQVALVSWDTAGNVIWSKSVQGISGGNDVEIDAAGNSYLLTSFANQVTATSGQDFLMYKFNAAGTQQWKKKYDFGGNDYPTRFTLVNNKLSVIGYRSVNAGYFDWVTLQTNAAGNKLWSSIYNATTSNDELPASIAAKANGEVFVTGKGGPAITGVTGSSFLRMITVKYSNTGVTKWIDSVNTSGFGLACTLAKDSSLFALSHTNMTAYHFLDQTGTATCGIPANVFSSNVGTVTASVTWSAVSGASLYHLRYKMASAANWTIVSTANTSLFLSGLSAGSTYQFAVEAVCSSGPSGYSTTQSFNTLGAGYCTTGGQIQAQEYLSFVWIGGIMNSTGNNNGYADYTNLSTPLNQGQVVTGYLSGLVRYPEVENYSIWIDYNKNNSFADPGEHVLNLNTDFTGWIGISFTVPTGIPGGATRMRVTMSYGGTPSPCGVYANGETEDYTVVISSSFSTTGKGQTTELFSQSGSVKPVLYPNPAADVLYIKGLNEMQSVYQAEIFDLAGKKVKSARIAGNGLNIQTLKTGNYFIRITQNNALVYSGNFLKK